MFLIQYGFIILTSGSDFSLNIIYLTRKIEWFCENMNRQETKNFDFDFLRFTYIYHYEMCVKKTDD